MALAFTASACEDPFFLLYDGGAGLQDGGPMDAGGGAPCMSLSPSIANYPAKGGVWGAVRVQDKALFSSNVDESFFFADLAEVAPTSAVVLPSGFSPYGMALRQDELWLGGKDGTLAHGSLSQSQALVRASTVALPAGIRFIETSPPGMPFELYAIALDDHTSSLYRFDGRRFEHVAEHPSIGSVFGTQDRGYGAIVWIAPGEVYAVLPYPAHPTCVVHYQPNSVGRGFVVDESTSAANSVLTTLANVPGVGVVAGTLHGQVLLRGDAGWVPLEGPLSERSSSTIRTILPLAHGFMVFTDADVAEWRQMGGFCDPVPYATMQFTEAAQAVDVPGGFVIVGPSSEDKEHDSALARIKVR